MGSNFKRIGKAVVITPEELAKSGSEHANQTALFAWSALAAKDYPPLRWLFAIPNANSHRMVSEGVRGGVPDICLPHPWDHFAGLYIEMKIEKRRSEKNGGCSEDQLKWIDYLQSAGYKVHVCYGWEEARARILEYLNG